MTDLPENELFAQAFFLADHAVVENGKLYANGAFWNRLAFSSFPASATFSVVAVLHIPWRALHTEHRLTAWFQDADSVRMPVEFQATFKLGASPDMKVGDPTILPVSAVVGNFTFPKPGDYAAVLEVDGVELAKWSFRASQVPGPAAPSGPPSPSDIPGFPPA